VAFQGRGNSAFGHRNFSLGHMDPAEKILQRAKFRSAAPSAVRRKRGEPFQSVVLSFQMKGLHGSSPGPGGPGKKHELASVSILFMRPSA
jgi:hypothetical protein